MKARTPRPINKETMCSCHQLAISVCQACETKLKFDPERDTVIECHSCGEEWNIDDLEILEMVDA